jgi:death-on-curing protein
VAEVGYVTAPELLSVAELLHGDPAVIDYGVPPLAALRPKLRAMGREVYPDVWAKAAAVAHTLIQLPALEHSNAVFGFAAAREFLMRNGERVTFEADAVARLASEVITHAAGFREIAVYLREATR